MYHKIFRISWNCIRNRAELPVPANVYTQYRKGFIDIQSWFLYQRNPPWWAPYMSRLMTKPTKWLCAKRRLRSAWAFAQSDQSLRCALKWVVKDPSCLHAHSHFVGFVMRRLIYEGGGAGGKRASSGKGTYTFANMLRPTHLLLFVSTVHWIPFIIP